MKKEVDKTPDLQLADILRVPALGLTLELTLKAVLIAAAAAVDELLTATVSSVVVPADLIILTGATVKVLEAPLRLEGLGGRGRGSSARPSSSSSSSPSCCCPIKPWSFAAGGALVQVVVVVAISAAA